jgi:AAA family ATP:ADP antiporter
MSFFRTRSRRADPSDARLRDGPSPVAARLSRALAPIARVEPHEVITALTMTLTVFLLLMAHYVLKTAREPLVLLHGGAEAKAYAAAGQSLLLLAGVPLYGALAQRVSRMKLIAGVYGFFALNLVLFALLALVGGAGVVLGVAFYLWVGVFNVTAIAVFWSFANDLYKPEQGKRLFAVLGVGSSVGAVTGALIARRLALLGPPTMMLSAAAILLACVALFALVHRREREHARVRMLRAGKRRPERRVIEGPVLARLARDRLVLWIALLTLLLNCVNANGEYVLDRVLLASLEQRGSGDAAAFVLEFKAEYFGWVNGLSLLLQLFVVSRVLDRFGVRRALFILPVVAFASYGSMVAAPILTLVLVGKIAENGLDYSVNNTARQALFLVGTRLEKYVGKTVVDTMVVRVGDVASAGVVALGSLLALPVAAFAAINLGLIACWLLVVVALAREHKRRSLNAQAATRAELMADAVAAEPARSPS